MSSRFDVSDASDSTAKARRLAMRQRSRPIYQMNSTA
jgi:hypothetical protein